MNGTDMEQVLDHFCGKISTIYSLIPLGQLFDNLRDKQSDNQWKRNAVLDSNCNNHYSDDYRKHLEDRKPDLREIAQMVVEMRTIVDDMRDAIARQRTALEEQSLQLELDIKRLDRHCDHINQNIPAFLSTNKANDILSRGDTEAVAKRLKMANKNNLKATARPTLKMGPQSHCVPPKQSQMGRVDTKSVKKRVISKEVKNVPKICFITTEEFASIPKYILGRLSYEVINRTVGDLNRAIAAKYKIIFNYSTKYSDEEMRKYMAFKEQENSETEGQFFCTMADLKELSDLKAEPKIRQVLTCLRHCKRVKEIRGNPAKLVRYALVFDPMAPNI